MIVHNPADVAVTDYPIENPKTKEVHLWTIKPGETLDFPQHVGEYLTEVYHFLQRVVTKEDRKLELEEEEKINKGQHFERVKVVDSVDSLKQPESVKVEKPETLEGFTSEETLTAPTEVQDAEKPAEPEMSGAVQSPAPAKSKPAVKPDLGPSI